MWMIIAMIVLVLSSTLGGIASTLVNRLSTENAEIPLSAVLPDVCRKR